ncbi:bifunctional adenosylcobinamide kinase/adenosylcobinamide-phosphate guanylyltransferase [Chlorobium ferrooxidans]|uniref:Adenosylcobinamide kinase n=1 Tax=Chlorobium ferrooxidans DSM 13031 TaxID=377431 RepID=Q0YQJ7_9CHLB|nr:bifunctional adenosylcobinamide kinase/adenosylcobinamide-phosphate guanylyltransferase [Chlorobium ferrooxidans]EAT58566.1 Cobalbumin biosynthesis enzyme [Chlorobium ferrooxidans DSM 13031]
MSKVMYVTGGARSGKSTFALQLAADYRNRVFVATAEPFDDEMQHRIGRHQEERSNRFMTLEEPLFPQRAFRNLPLGTDVVLFDCLTMWTRNLTHHLEDHRAIDEQITHFLDVLQKPPCDVILVSKEIGMGDLPDSAISRQFRDAAGMINQKVAAIATEAWLLCSGLSVRLK